MPDVRRVCTRCGSHGPFRVMRRRNVHRGSYRWVQQIASRCRECETYERLERERRRKAQQ